MMNNNMNNIEKIPQEKFQFVQLDARLHDKKLDTKARSYFADAMLRFSKNKSSVVAGWILLFLLLYSIIVPIISPYDVKEDKDTVYTKTPPYVSWIADMELGIFDGAYFVKSQDENEMVVWEAVEHELSRGRNTPLNEEPGYQSDYIGKVIISEKNGESYTVRIRGKETTLYSKDLEVNKYRSVGCVYRPMSIEEFKALQEWQNETGIQVIYPAIDPENVKDVNTDREKVNMWYKRQGGQAVKDKDGNLIPAYLTGEGPEYNSLRIDGDNGDYVYAVVRQGGQLQVRVSYYHYYIYQNGHEPMYVMGTTHLGQDLLTAIGAGAQFSLLFAVAVSAINMFIGTIYGAVQGYYGGWVDMVLDRIVDILSGVPFVVVTKLFQEHLQDDVGPVGAFIFAFVLTGWIGMAALVRKQFYRFKSLEFVMAARTLGAGDRRLMFKHIFPNALGTIITSCALVIPSAISSETSMTYLGIVNLEDLVGTTIGTLLSAGRSGIQDAPHAMLFPSLFFALLMICFNLFGNGLRDAFNPSTRGADD